MFIPRKTNLLINYQHQKKHKRLALKLNPAIIQLFGQFEEGRMKRRKSDKQDHTSKTTTTEATTTKTKTDNNNLIEIPQREEMDKRVTLPWRTAFFALLIARLFSALYNTITDCDETYNYWELSHLLVYGYGFQTWEYRFFFFFKQIICFKKSNLFFFFNF